MIKKKKKKSLPMYKRSNTCYGNMPYIFMLFRRYSEPQSGVKKKPFSPSWYVVRSVPLAGLCGYYLHTLNCLHCHLYFLLLHHILLFLLCVISRPLSVHFPFLYLNTLLIVFKELLLLYIDWNSFSQQPIWKNGWNTLMSIKKPKQRRWVGLTSSTTIASLLSYLV